jgi:predicted RNA-binding protein with RPS1 domain
MQKQLDKTIEKFKNSQTSIEAYEAISDFVKIIETVPKFIKQIKKEGKKIQIAQTELNADKGWNYGLSGRDLRDHNKRRDRKGEALFQLDPMFPLINLRNVHKGIKPKNIVANSDWLFHRFSPTDPLPETDRKEYQGFIDKLYKKILPFLNKEEKRDFGFDLDKSILYFQETEIHISLKNDKTNAHYILKHIFNSDDLDQQFSFSEIAEDEFTEDNNNWRKYYRACEDISKKVYKITKIDDFLEFSTGKTGWVRISKKYLK